MGDKRPAPPLQLENKVLKSLSASVGASTRHYGTDGMQTSLPGGPRGQPPHLENTLLARLSVQASGLTSTRSSLPLRSSVLAKYEAKHLPPPPPPVAETERVMAPPTGSVGFAAACAYSEQMACSADMLFSDDIEEESEEEYAFCAERSLEKQPLGRSLQRAKKKKRAYLAAPRFGGGSLFGSESWAEPEPQYDFKNINLGDEFDDRPTWISPEQTERPDMECSRSAKLDFLTAVCVSLVSQPDFKQQDDPLRQQLLRQATELARIEPEFILKVALYSRQELMLRTTSNFLLSLAAFLEPCRPFLRKYFCAAVRLPTDWIEVAELYQVFDDSKINFGSLPNALRKVMSDKFADFDNYQLAKYNKGGGKKKKKAKSKGERYRNRITRMYGRTFTFHDSHQQDGDSAASGSHDGSDGECGASDQDGEQTAKRAGKRAAVATVERDPDSETEEQLQRRSFTIKRLVRLLHIRRPVEPIMSIIGKKYPEDPDAFRRSGLPGTFDSSRAGQRMRLPVPETWETQVAQRGNKAEVWQQLIDNKKLPYMAMLRNLRNLILAKIGAAHHDKVISTLTNENAVLNSKQMVFRYLSAYAALDELEVLIKESMAEQEAPEQLYNKTKTERFSKDFWKDRKKRILKAKQQKTKYDLHVVERYRRALDRAVAIATTHNVPPISGRTLIFCDVSTDMDRVCASAKGMGKPKTARTMALLLSLMCLRSSENCQLILIGAGRPRAVPRQRNVDLLKQAADQEAAIVAYLTSEAGQDANDSNDSDWESASSTAGEDDDEWPSTSRPESRAGKGAACPNGVRASGCTSTQLADDVTPVEAFLDSFLHRREWLDNLVVMGSGAGSWHVSRSLQLFRDRVNPSLQFVNVDLIHTASDNDHMMSSPLNVNLFGFSDQILRFVADGGTTGQLAAVEAIDVKYNLRRDIRLPAINLREAILASEAGVGVTRWRTVRVFISSTFLDFHGERDLLIRHALPELRSRARSLRLDLQVVDLRWGITAQDSESARQVELCLSEVDRCQLFVGLLGARSGQTADTSRVTDPRLLDFLKTQPADLSLTALEMLYATRDAARAQETAVFYERDESFVRRVPGELMDQFSDLAPGRRRVAALRSQLQSRGCLITKYQAEFGPLGRGRQGATDLQTFGQNVLEQLWNSMQALYPLEDEGCDLVTEEYTLQHESAVSRQLVGRKTRLARAVELVEHGQGRFVLVSGKPGSGKTTFMARVYTQLVDTSDAVSRLLVPAFCSAGQQCASSVGLLAYLRALLARQPISASPRHRQAAELTELLAVRGRRQHVVLVLDGLDALWTTEGEAAADWIPDKLPQNVTLVVSADEGSPLYRRLNSLSMVTAVTLGSLDLSERSGLVRETLQHHSKTLEEKAWNNQLRTLTSKRGAGDPLYLQLACEELRTFGVFEQLSVKLSSLGQTITALIQDIIGRLEDAFDATMVKQALCAVTIASHGLAEDELFEFLKQDWPQLTQFTFTSFVRSGESLLQRCSAPGQPALLRVPHAEMGRGIRTRYLAGPHGPAATRQLARALAEFFERRGGLDEEKFQWKVPPSVLQALPFFWGLTEDMDQYRRVICSLRFLMLKTQSGLAAELLADVRASQLADSAARRLYLEHPHVTEVVDFVSHNLSLFSRSPSLVLQQALNEPADSWLRSCGEELLTDSQPTGTAVVRLACQLRSSVSEPRPCQMTLRPAESITAAAADPDRELLYVGLPNGEVKLYDLTSGRETRTFTGHGEQITCLALLPGGSHLASGAADGQLSIWETNSGRRLAVTRAHRRRLTCLAVQPDGAEFVSVSWSCDIKLWRFRPSSGISAAPGGGELEEVRLLDRGSRPVSCAAFHPSRPLVAVGGWDGKVKIWDTAEMQRKAVRHGHDSSVRCLAISPDAGYLVSGDMGGNLIVWGTKHGDWIQKSRVHTASIVAVCYLGAEKFVTAGADGDIKMWRSHVGSEVHQLPSSAAVILALSAPHSSLLTVTNDGQVTLEPTVPAAAAAPPPAGRRGPPRWSRRLENVTSAACDDHRVYLAVGRAVHVLKMSDGRPERQLATGAPVTSLACLPAEAADSVMGVILLGLQDGRVGVALADRGELVTTVAHAGEVTSIAVNVHDPERPRMATGGRDGMVLLWSGEDSWEKPYRSLEAYSVPVSALAWMCNELVTAGQDSQMHVYPSPDENDERRLLAGNDAPVTSLSVHAGGPTKSQRSYHMLSSTAGGQTLLWSSRLMAVTEQRCRPGSRPDLTRLADGRLVALLPREADTNVVDMEKMSCIASFGDHTAAVSSVAFTNRSFISASLDGSAKLWRPEMTGLASTDAGLLALQLLHVVSDEVTCYLATVNRRGHVTVWRLKWTEQQTPEAIYTLNLLEKETDPELMTANLGSIGAVSRADPATGAGVTFTAGCLTASLCLRADITLTLGEQQAAVADRPAVLSGRHSSSGAPVVCMAVGRQRCLMLGDSAGRVTVYDQHMEKHAQYQCGAGSHPSITHITRLGRSSVVTCDKNGMLCTFEQTEKLNILRAAWQPILLSSSIVKPPLATDIQVDKDARRVPAPAPTQDLPPAYRGLATGSPTALLASSEPQQTSVVGDSAGQLWWASSDGDEQQSMKAHSAAVTWLGRDPARADILYSCGEDRRLVVWRLRALRSPDLPAPEQVGEFEFASSVRVCTALPAQAPSGPTRLVCGDDRGRLHCLLVDLRRVPEAGGQPPSVSHDSEDVDM